MLEEPESKTGEAVAVRDVADFAPTIDDVAQLPDRRGFARAAIVECLHRLKAMGIRSAYIMGYSREALALYGSLGAIDEQEAYTYERGS